MKKSEECLHDLQDANKRTKLQIIEVSEGKERESSKKDYLKK